MFFSVCLLSCLLWGFNWNVVPSSGCHSSLHYLKHKYFVTVAVTVSTKWIVNCVYRVIKCIYADVQIIFPICRLAFFFLTCKQWVTRLRFSARDSHVWQIAKQMLWKLCFPLVIVNWFLMNHQSECGLHVVLSIFVDTFTHPNISLLDNILHVFIYSLWR